MIKFYGTPISPISTFNKIMPGRNALVSFAHHQDITRAFKICDKVILDNGAYSFWTKGLNINWNDYYTWVNKYPKRFFFLIPDVIDGTETENDKLIEQCPYSDGVPVWHVGESLKRLARLSKIYDIIAFGSSGELRQLGTPQWHLKMHNAMKIVCNSNGVPKIKIHMLRCLNHKIFTKYPFYSGDSSTLGRNHKSGNWKDMVKRVEKHNSPKKYNFLQGGLCTLSKNNLK